MVCTVLIWAMGAFFALALIAGIGILCKAFEGAASRDESSITILIAIVVCGFVGGSLLIWFYTSVTTCTTIERLDMQPSSAYRSPTIADSVLRDAARHTADFARIRTAQNLAKEFSSILG